MLKHFFILASLASAFLLPQAPALAACSQISLYNDCITSQRQFGFDGSACNTTYPDCAPSGSSAPTSTASTGSVVTLTNPLGTTDPRQIVGNLIKAILSIIGSVTLLMFIYGGVVWITSMGNDKLVQKGKQILVWTTLGLGVIAGAYTLTNAVIQGLTTGSALGG